MLKQLDGQFAQPGRNAGSTLKYNPKSQLSLCKHFAISEMKQMSNSTFRKIFFSVLVQSNEASDLSPSQFTRLLVWSKLGSRNRMLSYSVGVVATGLRMGVGKSLIGHIGEMALWL